MAITGGVGIGAPPAPGIVRGGPRPTGGVGIPSPGGIVRGSSPGGINYNKFIPKGARGPYQQQPGAPIGAPPKSSPQQAQGAENSNPGGNDNLDATYFANTATNQFNTNNKINALTEQGAQNEVALQSALGQLGNQQPYDQLREEFNANRSGGLYSTVEGQNEGRIAQSYLDRSSALTSNNQNTQGNIASQIKALEGGIPLYNASQALASSGRLAKIAANNPAVAPPPSAAIIHGGGKGTPGSPGGGSGAPGAGGIIHGGAQGGIIHGGKLAAAIIHGGGKGKGSGGVGIGRPSKGKGKPSKSGGSGY